tara:strand:- start:3187 stop:4218 length:1032 start_codon:yes stop_codon:yes gene_type:complete
MNISYTTPYEHPMLNTKKDVDSRNALDVMENAGALFEVHYPAATWGYDGDHPTITSGKNEGLPLYKWVVRTDTDEPLGLHSGTFAESGSYRQVGEMAEKMFPNSATSCTLFGKGERMALTQDIGEKIDLGDGDVIQPSIMWISSFNGQWSTGVFDLIGRLFCANQLVGQTPLFSVKHTRNHDVTFEQRTSVLVQTIERAEQIGRMAKIMKDQPLVDREFEALIKKVVPVPPFIKDQDGKNTDRIHAKAEKNMIANRKAMTTMWQKECAEFGLVYSRVKPSGEEYEVFDGNKWLAYNAVQGAEQHQISTDFMTTEQAQQKSLIKAVNGRTPYADRTWNILVNAN